MEDLGYFLFKIRNREKLTQKEMASKIGISAPRYNQYELGKNKKLNVDFITKFRDIFIDILTDEELNIINEVINNKSRIILSKKEYQEYQQDEPFNIFLQKFKSNHMFTQKEMAKKLGIENANYNRYELGNTEIKNINFITKFRNTFIDILTKEELVLLDKYFISLSKSKETEKINSTSSILIVSKFLKKFRITHMMKQAEIASKLNMDDSNYSCYEKGTRKNIKPKFLINFRDTFFEILTEDEKNILDELISNCNINKQEKKLLKSIEDNLDKNSLMQFSKFLKKFRTNHNLSIVQISQKLNIPYSTYYRYEHKNPKFINKEFLINFYNTFNNELSKDELNLIKLYLSSYLINEEDLNNSSKIKNLNIVSSTLDSYINSELNIDKNKVNLKTIN